MTDQTINAGGYVNFTIKIGMNWNQKITIFNDCDQQFPLILNTSIFCMQVRPDLNLCKKPMLTLSTSNGGIIVTDIDKGILELVVTPEFTEEIKFRGDSIECVYDLVIIHDTNSQNEHTSVLMSGTVTFIKTSSRGC